MSGIVDIAKGANIKPEVVAEIFDEIMARCQVGEEVRIKGFGTFRTKMYPGRTLQSPAVADGEPIEFPDSLTLKFRQSTTAKVKMNTAKPAKALLKKLRGEAKIKKAEKKAKEAAKAKAKKGKK